MKRFAVLILILLLSGIATESFAQKKGREVVCFQSDMDCVDCEKTLYEHLRFEKGVKDLKVDHASNTILIEFAENKNDEKQLAGAIEKKGYKAVKIDRETYDQILSRALDQNHHLQKEVQTVRD